MKLFYGTGNASKLRNMRTLLEGLPIELISPLEVNAILPLIEEDGKTPWENAKKKAMAYHRATGLPSMGLDSGLYLEGISDELQPGTHVRRVGNCSMTDSEFILYYSSLARKYGGRIKARFLNGICVVINEECMKYAGGIPISTDWFWIVEKPHAIHIDGFPMDSIAVNPRTGRYWVEADMENERDAKGTDLAHGIRRFFTELVEQNYQSTIVEDIKYAAIEE